MKARASRRIGSALTANAQTRPPAARTRYKCAVTPYWYCTGGEAKEE